LTCSGRGRDTRSWAVTGPWGSLSPYHRFATRLRLVARAGEEPEVELTLV
jgi:hypothetical protein